MRFGRLQELDERGDQVDRVILGQNLPIFYCPRHAQSKIGSHDSTIMEIPIGTKDKLDGHAEDLQISQIGTVANILWQIKAYHMREVHQHASRGGHGHPGHQMAAFI
jgi:hypothetical protein